MKRLCQRIRRKRGVRAEDVIIPVASAPGQVAQVDFGFVGRLADPGTGELRKAWVFLMVLGHSRHMFAKIVFRQDTVTWLQLHVDSFHHFGGVPGVTSIAVAAQGWRAIPRFQSGSRAQASLGTGF